MGAPRKIAIVVPTIGRCAELRRMLASVAAQTRLPDQVLIVGEGGDNAEIARQFPRLNAEFIPMPGSSICAKRNRGARQARPDADWIAFMDDDIVLEPGAIEALLQFWERAPGDLGGASCRFANHPPVYARRLKSCRIVSRLALYDMRNGLVLRSGVHTQMSDMEEDAYVQWLPSGAVAYSRKALAEFAFDEWMEGYSYLEDLDLSYRIGKKYRLAVVAGARFHHYPSNVGRPDAYRFGKKEVLNRLHFVAKHAELSLALCGLALSIRAAMNLFLGISRREGDYFRRFAGNVAGAFGALGHAIRNRARAALRVCAGAASVRPSTATAPERPKQ